MNEEAYSVALKNTLTEIQSVCPEIKWSFIFTNNGTIYAGDDEANNPATEKAAHSLQALVQKASAVGGLDNLSIEGEDGNLYVSCIDDMYLVTATSKSADVAYLRSFTKVVFSTVLRLLGHIVAGPTLLKPVPSSLKEGEEKTPELVSPKPQEQLLPVPSQQLIVDKLSGFMVRADTVQVDQELLKRWGELPNIKQVSGVEIESFSGKTVQCKVKGVSDPRLEGRGLIRIPEKTCQTLEIRKGELVRVKPIVS